MKENKGRFPWKEGARFETLDHHGHVWQYENKPTQWDGLWWATGRGDSWYLGDYALPLDYTKTLIERYPSESETAPFTFGPEHVGKRVRYVDGSKGIVLAVDPSASISDQLVIRFDKGEVAFYSLMGKVFASDKDAVIFLDESEAAPAETDAPDLQAKVKELERLTSRMDSAAEIIERHVDAIWDYRMRIEALEAEVKELRESREMVHRFVPARTYLDDMRFVVPGAKSDVGVFSFTGDIEAPAEPDPTAQIAQLQAENEELRKIKQFPWTIEYKSTQIDPTAQKVEALKLLFPWCDGCDFMTVDAKFGIIWQWGNEPVNDSKVWASKGCDANARRIGQINSPDPELCQILIKRNDGE